MNKKEAKEVVNAIVTAQPALFKDYTDEQFALLAGLWADAFKNIPYGMVKKSLVSVLYKQKGYIAPVQYIAHVNDDLKATYSSFNAEREWENLMWIVRNVSEKLHRAPEKYLDEISQEIVDEYYIRKLKMDSKYCEFEHGNFVKRYTEEKEARERKAIETGNLALMCSDEKMQELGLRRTETALNAPKEAE